MANLNLVQNIGRVTRDPECRYTPKGTAVIEIGLAINRQWKDDSGQKREETTYADWTFFGRQAEILGQYMTKGKELYCSGRLQTDTWDDRETGLKRSKLRVIGESFQFLGGRDDSPTSTSSSRSNNQPRRAANTPPPSRNSRPEDNPDNMGYDEADPDPIPF